ncbi:MAG: cytochrome c biogenesis protein CcsA [Bacteroidales bacterium]|jgi:ABC-type transport system involved in cytochrome c biogenesis permease subunit|nr:cytochrome c biogenesis protein CcsA [Bacteroidales bacterium]
MNPWNDFIYLALPAMTCWLVAIPVLYWSKHRWTGPVLSALGLLIFAAFIGWMWVSLERPPMRTMGETRLWYSLFLSGIGLILYLKWSYKWLFAFSQVLAVVFVVINLLKPEIHSKALMPALQSVWFIPHVTTYMLSYALLSAATLAAILLLVKGREGADKRPLIDLTDNLVYVGLGLFLIGLLIGALWAKEAWGDFWSWDPKETWAFLTAAVYLIYVHLRLKEPHMSRLALWLLVLAFVCLMITWKGVSYLPSAQGSVHVYG